MPDKVLSILITHYNRSDELLECINEINEIDFGYSYEVVVSDDGSLENHVQNIKTFPIDVLVLSDKNLGLAANLNKGIKACSGKYIIYCQEDFFIKKSLKKILPDCFDLLDSKKIDMVRFTANYSFPKLMELSNYVNIIPKFSFQNFKVNAFQYSDHPFITTQSFYNEYGYYLENTSGPYGETEFAIRIFKSKAKIGITKEKQVRDNQNAESVMQIKNPVKKNIKGRKLRKIARAIRQHIEVLLYNKNIRKLYTYKNNY